jgi:hypothetical protein
MNPIYLLDVEHLIAWPNKTEFRKGREAYTLNYESSPASDLPARYGFDRYGLVVFVRSQVVLAACTTTAQESSTHPYDSEDE